MGAAQARSRPTHDVECRPRRASAYDVEELSSCASPVGELIIPIPAPGGNHRQNEEAEHAQEFLIGAGIALADLFRHVSEIELDRSAAARLEIDEQRPALRAEQVARVRLSVQQLLGARALVDRATLASQRGAEKLPVRALEPWSQLRALDESSSFVDAAREVRNMD